MNIVRTVLCLLLLAAEVAIAQNATNNPTNTSPNQPSNAGDSSAPSLTPNNATLQGQIQQALRNASEVDASRVFVNVTDAAIEISGTVPSSQDKQAVERLARSFDGNRKFTNDLTITGQAPVQRNSMTLSGAASGSKAP